MGRGGGSPLPPRPLGLSEVSPLSPHPPPRGCGVCVCRFFVESEGASWQIHFWRGCWACSVQGAGVRRPAVAFPSPRRPLEGGRRGAGGGKKRCWGGEKRCWGGAEGEALPGAVLWQPGRKGHGALWEPKDSLGRGSLVSPYFCGMTAQWEHGLSPVSRPALPPETSR